MAGSGIAAHALKNSLSKANGSIEWDAAASAWKGALYNSTGVNAWNFASANLAYTSTNEHAGTGGYTAGGAQPDAGGALTVATQTNNGVTNTYLSWDIGDFAWTNATLASVKGILIYAVEAGNSDNPAAVGVDFGQNYAVTSGTFGVQWAAPGANGGVFYINLTP